MIIIPAGYSIDKNFLDDYKNSINMAITALEDESIKNSKTESVIKYLKIVAEKEPTPETISAAYARISRDPRIVTKLREIAREEVNKARKSNQNIVFRMGHHSVAEHVTLNFDVIGVSRLAMEELEARRIGSAYTEKSQRYITLDGDFITPNEYDFQDKKNFLELVKLTNGFYFRNLDKLIDYQFLTNKELADQAFEAKMRGVHDNVNNAKNTLEGWAKEDARYGLLVATQIQAGISFNARTLEYAIRVMRNSDLEEVRDLSEKFFNASKKIAPSLIILSDPKMFKKQFNKELEENHLKYSRKNFQELVTELINNYHNQSPSTINFLKQGDVTLINDKNVDLEILTALIHHNSKISMEQAHSLASKMIVNDSAEEFLKKGLKHISEFDSLPREFEFSNLKYEVTVSSSNFAQLKRHRIMTLLPQEYNPELGIIIPEAIKEIGSDSELEMVCERSAEVFYDLKKKYGRPAEYTLTNAHKRRVLIAVNPRELYHISRLRMDKHSQWDIRQTAKDMITLAKQSAPLTFMLAGGKDEFKNIKQEIYRE